jgi:hypothetical protein
MVAAVAAVCSKVAAAAVWLASVTFTAGAMGQTSHLALVRTAAQGWQGRTASCDTVGPSQYSIPHGRPFAVRGIQPCPLLYPPPARTPQTNL